MNNDKFINVYIDILQKTLNDWLLQNVSLQANAKVSEDVISEQVENIQNLNGKVEELTRTVNDLEQQKQNETNSEIKSYKDKIENLENAIRDHLNTINNLNSLKTEYESIKSQAQHVDSFREDLIRERENHQNTRREFENKLNELITKHGTDLNNLKTNYENQVKELSDKVDYLQLTPAKRKKFDEEQAKLLSPTPEVTNVVETKTEPKSDLAIEDGGTF